MKKSALHLLSQMIFYLMGYFILLEWLYPLKAIADIDHMYVFYLFLILPFYMYFFSGKIILKFLILAVYVIWANHYYYFNEYSIWDIQWIAAFLEECVQSIVALFQFDIGSITYSFQTVLLFILLWVMTYLIHYWIMVQRSIFLFFFLSVLYVTILDTFTVYDGNWAIVRLFCIGFLLIGHLTFQRLLQRNLLSVKQRQYGSWTMMLILMIVLSSSIAYAMPKPDSQWPDPVPFIMSYSEKFKDEEPVNKAGYDWDDSRLGGDFIPDDTVVFTAKTSKKHYWKVETKDTYTTAGWTTFDKGEPFYFDNRETILYGCCTKVNQSIDQFNVDSNQPVEYLTKRSDLYLDSVDVKILYPHIPYPASMVEGNVIANDEKQPISFQLQMGSNMIRSLKMEDGFRGLTKLKSYKTSYKLPIFNVDDLKKVTELPPEDRMRLLTYLEPSPTMAYPLPEQVKELALEITKDKTNWYDKAKAIEDYFDRPEFVYEQTGIPYPAENQDFVSHFLFETKRGYCDHFSTSMAVMLRTLGIPTRWVKGYTEGEFQKYENGRSVYNITNNNAHSWVEVYFPNAGWVPFEPTKGYNNPAQFVTTTKTTTQKPQKETTIKRPEQKEQEQEQVKQQSGAWENIKERIELTKKNLTFIVAGIVVLFILVLAFFFSRRKWLPYYWFWYFKRKDDSEETFAKAYLVLLKQLKRAGLERKKDQTLREYADYVDDYYEMDDMKKLTYYYERTIYRGEEASGNWKKAKKSWEKVMKITIT